jgi:LDH2 family malate/lactate/ureidoglycolate dehydrogenase
VRDREPRLLRAASRRGMLRRAVFGASAAFSASASSTCVRADSDEAVRVPLSTLQSEFLRVLRSERVDLPPDVAALCAKLFMENQRDGVYSHGLNRFGGFVSAVVDGRFDKAARPTVEQRFGCVEQWDGHCGIGLWNAHVATSRAVDLARKYGIGCVALRNTNHWMRAGSYGLQAARAGCVGICFTNTCPLLPPWGSAEARIGNNPLCIAIPRGKSQEPLLLDMAMVRQHRPPTLHPVQPMVDRSVELLFGRVPVRLCALISSFYQSQYSNGKLQVLSRSGRELPLAGGFDVDGELTTDPAAILASRRALPVGYWKGSGQTSLSCFNSLHQMFTLQLMHMHTCSDYWASAF